MEGLTKERWIVSGRVQGVGYRYFTRRAARGLGIAGDVRNLPDGTVELRVVAPAEILAALEEELRRGPTHGRVDAVERTPLTQGEGPTPPSSSPPSSSPQSLSPQSLSPQSFEIRY